MNNKNGNQIDTSCITTTSASAWPNSTGTPTYVDIDNITGSIQRRKKFNSLSAINNDGEIGMGHNNIHIQPTNNGFLVTMYTNEDGPSFYTFKDFKEVGDFLSKLSIMDLDSENVADNL